MQLLQSTNALKTNRNSKNSKRLKESEKKKKERSNDLESSKRKLQIDKLKSMLCEQREPSKREKDKLEKEKSSNRPRDSVSRLTSRRQDKSSSRRKPLPQPSRLEQKERTTCTRFRSRSKSSCRKEKSKRIESRHSLITLIRSGLRLQPTKISKSKIDLTSWKKAERLEKKSTMREIKSREFSKPKYRSFRTSAQTTSISTNSTRRLSPSEPRIRTLFHK